MTLKKFTTYIYYVGCLVFVIGCIANILVKHTSFLHMSRSATAFVMLAGIVLMLPLLIYKDFHHKEFKKENKERWIHTATIIGLLALMIIIKEYVL